MPAPFATMLMALAILLAVIHEPVAAVIVGIAAVLVEVCITLFVASGDDET